MNRLARVTGRFQPVHAQHRELFEIALRDADHLIVAVTNPDSGARHEEPTSPHRHPPDANPFTFFERARLLQLVARYELAAGEVAAAFDITRTAVSQHLTVLTSAGLLVERRDGTRRPYRARPKGLAGLRELLDDIWSTLLDVARRLGEADAGGEETGFGPEGDGHEQAAAG